VEKLIGGSETEKNVPDDHHPRKHAHKREREKRSHKIKGVSESRRPEKKEPEKSWFVLLLQGVSRGRTCRKGNLTGDYSRRTARGLRGQEGGGVEKGKEGSLSPGTGKGTTLEEGRTGNPALLLHSKEKKGKHLGMP